MKHKLLWAGLILLTLVGGFIGLVHWLSHEPIGPAGFRQLHPGMTRAEIVGVLGSETTPPHMWERFISSDVCLPELEWGELGLWTRNKIQWGCWENARYTIEVYFDDQDQALMGNLFRIPGAPKTIWQRLRAWW